MRLVKCFRHIDGVCFSQQFFTGFIHVFSRHARDLPATAVYTRIALFLTVLTVMSDCNNIVNTTHRVASVSVRCVVCFGLEKDEIYSCSSSPSSSYVSPYLRGEYVAAAAASVCSTWCFFIAFRLLVRFCVPN